jgi:hypothetical protein
VVRSPDLSTVHLIISLTFTAPDPSPIFYATLYLSQITHHSCRFAFALRLLSRTLLENIGQAPPAIALPAFVLLWSQLLLRSSLFISTCLFRGGFFRHSYDVRNRLGSSMFSARSYDKLKKAAVA